MNLKVGQKFGVKKDYYVKEIIKTVARLKEILNNEIISEPIGIVTKKGDLMIISEAFLRSKKRVNEGQLYLFHSKIVERGCFLVSFEPVDVVDAVEENIIKYDYIIYNPETSTLKSAPETFIVGFGVDYKDYLGVINTPFKTVESQSLAYNTPDINKAAVFQSIEDYERFVKENLDWNLKNTTLIPVELVCKPVDVPEPIEEPQIQVEEVTVETPISEDSNINNEDLPIFQPISSTENDLSLEELAHKESMDAYNQGIEIKSGAVTFNLIALVITLIAFKFFIHIDQMYFYIGGVVVLIANFGFFVRFRKSK